MSFRNNLSLKRFSMEKIIHAQIPVHHIGVAEAETADSGRADAADVLSCNRGLT